MRASAATPEHGFTIVEVMVAMAILLVGVLGAVALIDGANAQTSRTKAREGATALGRTVLEIGRGVPYGDLSGERILAELELRAGLGDASPDAGHQVESRGFTYTVAPTVCAMDDPKDSLGEHDETGVTFCADTDTLSGSPATVDRNPDDYRRMAVTLSWRVGAAPVESTTQTGIVTNPVGGLGPSVTELIPRSPATAAIGAGHTVAEYDVTTSAAAEDVAWTVNGARMGSATGSDRDWDFSWALGPPDDPLFLDCTYVVQAEAYDDKGRAGAPRALTVTVDRRRPFAPAAFAGGRNGNGDHVDLEWQPNRECDVERYDLFRGTGGGPADTLVCTVEAGEPTECVDQDAPAGPLVYELLAYDAGAHGDGDTTAPLVVADAADNQPPDQPATLTVCTGGAFEPPCLDIEGAPAPDGTAALSWPPVTDPDGDAIRYYRVYRGGTGYGDRLDVLFPVVDDLGQPVTPLVFVDNSGAPGAQYWVTAVDEHFAESAPTGPVTWSP
ncbi:MAG: prepilin-type N-terminal cleavage/methylation domain-containing protein [Solirubrobacterales bacterium]|nr:prepilin-type N-terminal cleavage/methylation domain-containing protein [Solirubrobacterales bacterium]